MQPISRLRIHVGIESVTLSYKRCVDTTQNQITAHGRCQNVSLKKRTGT